jgi:lysophospholipase L1-like esterase
VKRWRLRLAGLLAALLPACGMADTAPACPPVAVPPIVAPAFAAAIAGGGEVRIVAIGSSSTAGAGASLPWRAYPGRLEARLRAAIPGHAITVMNRGAGGEDAANMLGRMERDAIAERPDLVIWQVGANAALRSMDREPFARFLREGLERLRTAGIDVVLMDNQRAPRIAARPGHRDYDAMLAEAAAGVPGVTLFSRGALMDAWAAAGVPNDALLVSDMLHHNDRGYACIAEALSAALVAGLPARPGAAPPARPAATRH